jgi:hypothetical protein
MNDEGSWRPAMIAVRSVILGAGGGPVIALSWLAVLLLAGGLSHAREADGIFLVGFLLAAPDAAVLGVLAGIVSGVTACVVLLAGKPVLHRHRVRIRLAAGAGAALPATVVCLYLMTRHGRWWAAALAIAASAFAAGAALGPCAAYSRCGRSQRPAPPHPGGASSGSPPA